MNSFKNRARNLKLLYESVCGFAQNYKFEFDMSNFYYYDLGQLPIEESVYLWKAISSGEPEAIKRAFGICGIDPLGKRARFCLATYGAFSGVPELEPIPGEGWHDYTKRVYTGGLRSLFVYNFTPGTYRNNDVVSVIRRLHVVNDFISSIPWYTLNKRKKLDRWLKGL